MAGFFAASLDPSAPDAQTPDSYDAILRKRKLAEALLGKGAFDTSPVQSWTQGLARMAQAWVAGDMQREADAKEKASNAKYDGLMNALLGGGAAPAPGGTAPSLGPIASDGQPAPVPPADIPGSASSSPDKSGFVAQMTPHALKVAQETGLDPRLVIAQAALETGYGKSAPGNNFFGIKSHGAPGGNTLPTTEVVNGQPVRVNDSFRAYADMGDSAAGYANFLKSNPRYAPLLQAQGLDAQIAALGKSGYATDPDYAAKIASIAKGINLPPNALAAINQAAPVQVASNAPGLGYAPSSGGASLSGNVPPQVDELTVKALQDYARRKNLQPPAPEMGPASPLQNTPMLPGAAPILPPGLSAANGPAGGAGLVNPDAISPGALTAGPGPSPLRDTGDGSYNNPFLEGSPEAKAAGANLPAPGAVPAGPAGFSVSPASGMDRAKMALAIAMNPSFSPQQRQMAMSVATMLQGQDKPMIIPEGATALVRDGNGGYRQVALGGAKQTSDQREYELARQQGFQGSFIDYQTMMKKAGATNISIDQKTEGAFDQKIAGKQADLFASLAEDGLSAKTDIANIGALRDNISKLPGGFLGGAQAIAKSYGIALGPNASNVEAANAIISKLVPAQRQGMPGAASDRDVQMFKDSLPKLSNTPEGNKVILDTMEALARYKAAQGEIAGKVMTGQMNRNDAMRQLQALPDPMSAFKAAQKNTGLGGGGGEVARPLNKSEFDALPSGTPFIDPNGTKRIKP